MLVGRSNFRSGRNGLASLTFEELLEAGAHFGHATRKWNPKMEPYIFMAKNGIHVIDLERTLAGIEAACEAIHSSVSAGGTILFIGTKRTVRELVRSEAERCGMYYVVERWLGGILTNFVTVRRSIRRLEQLDEEATEIYSNLTKKEVLTFERERLKLERELSGIKAMKKLPNLVYVIDANREINAVREAARLELPIIAVIDTNSDPTPIEYVIPGNDDSIRALTLITRTLTDAVLDGTAKRRELIESEVAEAEAELG